ncbi:hypothetical protein QA601_17305 [Chitinispirillales bacterium ANBcel5]|uniref:aspartate:alanine exchanger family transporter n=1 Tax=Cellulosispirillum alkaliphilum TaxID=3039283 RepID=UPI002A55FF7F|nr:hypothetical protein [Chitinispirillales bacterium ANBcel5]
MNAFFEFLHDQLFFSIFLVLGIGHLLGRVQFGSLKLGSTSATLFSGIIISATVYFYSSLRFEIPEIVETIFLLLFLFVTGLRVAPQFLSGISREGTHLLIITLIVASLNFFIVMAASRSFEYPPGLNAGIIAGSSTVTALVGVASNLIDSETYTIPQGYTYTQIRANITAAYAVLYIFSTLGIVILCRYFPRLSKIEPVSAARKTEKEHGDNSLPLPGTGREFAMGYLPVDTRAYILDNIDLDGKPLSFIQKHYGISVARVVRNGSLLDVTSDPILHCGDRVTIFGPIEQKIKESKRIGREIVDKASLDIPITPAEIVVQSKEIRGKTLQDLREITAGLGLYTKALFRQAHQMPLLCGVKLEKGDVLRVLGTEYGVKKAAERIGTVLLPSTSTSLATLAFGLIAGFLLGLLSIPMFGIPFTLSTSGGVIVSGIALGILRTYNPRLGGATPDPALDLMQNLGLDLFITVLALNVAPELVEALGRGGELVSVLAIGMIAALIPSICAWFVGLYLFKMDPIILTGALAGARASIPALSAAQEQFKSITPAIGFPLPYALSSIVVIVYGYIAMILG